MEKSLEDLFSLEGKTAVITGGSGHLGSSMSYTISELGANVIIASRDYKKCESLASDICKEFEDPNLATAYELDVNDDKKIRNLVNFVEKKFDRLDILVNAAYSGKTNSFESITEEEWNHDLNTGLNSVFRMTKSFLPHLKESEGNILNVASMYGHLAPDYRIYQETDHTNPPSYGAAKAGVIQLTRYLASFLSKYNIRVNAISPGPFPFGDILENEEFINRLSNKNPLNRVGKPYEIKGIVALLCSEASSYITGQNIRIDGGWSIW